MIEVIAKIFNKTLVVLTVILQILFLTISCASQTSIDNRSTIDRIALMPNSPEPYHLRDWNKVALGFDAFAFDFDAEGKYLPLVVWDESQEHYKGKSFSMRTYIGGGGFGDEGINTLGAVVASTLAGIDKSTQNGNNFVEMCQKWYVSERGIYSNNPGGGRAGLLGWYGLMPNILAYQLNYLYPNTDQLPNQIISIADLYCDVVSELRDLAPGEDYPKRHDKDMGAAIGWFEYMTYVETGNSKYLDAADLSLKYLEQRPVNPLYEVLLSYGALVAARMNAELDRDYDVSKLLNWCFDGDADTRVGWGVIADNWNGLDVSGLQGSVTDGEGYAFAMNTFQMAGALTPLVRYDDSYAHDIGKWMLNIANASRLFYWNAHDPEHQSSYNWASMHDPKAVVAYEGMRKWKRGSDKALADTKTVQGKVVKGDYTDTYLRDSEYQVIKETTIDGITCLEHIWEFELPEVEDRWFVVVGDKVDGGHKDNKFQFSFSNSPDGPFNDMFVIPQGKRASGFALASEGINFSSYHKLPKEMAGKLYVKVKSTNPSDSEGKDKLSVGAMAITYTSNLGPYAQGDFVVSFIDLIENSTIPIVMYRSQSDCTDLGVYGSSHVGILGALVCTTNVEKILQLDLLKTDYYHDKAYPTFLYYNPYNETKMVEIETGNDKVDLYDAVTNTFLKKNVSGSTSFGIQGDDARVIVLVPSRGEKKLDGKKLLVNNVVVDYDKGNVLP